MRKKIVSVSYTVFLFVCFLLIQSCNNNVGRDDPNSNTKMLIFDEIIDSLPASDFYKKVKYITLETNVNSVIASITKVIVANNRIFVFDQQQSAFFLFDISGRHISTINLKGKGPNEMVRITDCDFNPETMEYAVFGDQTKLIFLDNNLNPLKDQILDYKGIHFAFLKSGYALNTHFYLNMDRKSDPITQVIVVDEQSKLLDRFFSNPLAKVIHHSTSFSFFRSDGVIFTLPSSNLMLWFIDDKIEEWEIDFGKYGFDYNDLYDKAVKSEIGFDDIYFTRDKVSFFTQAYMVNDLLHFSGIHNRKYITCFYDFKKKKSYAFKNMYNDLNDYPLGRIKAATNDYFVYTISTEEVFESSLNDSLKLDLIDNPILAFYYE